MVRFDDDDIFPVTRITAGAVGEPGQRVFILQAYVGGQPYSWVIEKEQALALSKILPQLLERVKADYPELGDPVVAAKPNLALGEPLEPEFRVASIGLGYDRLHDLVVLTLAEARDEQDEEALTDDEYGEEPLVGEDYARINSVEAEVTDELAGEDIARGEDNGAEDGSDLQLYATRGQALLLGQQAELIIAAGRPACPNCGQPIDDFGHFCLPPTTRTRWNTEYLQ